jgi:hypothetical protein
LVIRWATDEKSDSGNHQPSVITALIFGFWAKGHKVTEVMTKPQNYNFFVRPAKHRLKDENFVSPIFSVIFDKLFVRGAVKFFIPIEMSKYFITISSTKKMTPHPYHKYRKLSTTGNLGEPKLFQQFFKTMG